MHCVRASVANAGQQTAVRVRKSAASSRPWPSPIPDSRWMASRLDREGVHPAPAIPVIRDGLQVGHQAADGRFGKDIALWNNGGHEGYLASMWLILSFKAQNDPLCDKNGLGLQTVGFGSYGVHCLINFVQIFRRNTVSGPWPSNRCGRAKLSRTRLCQCPTGSACLCQIYL